MSIKSSKKNSPRSKSALEESFLVENAFKRNKRYLDYGRINNVEQEYSADRRRPNTSSSVDEKINNSFLNTTAAFSDRVEQDIDKFKHRLSGVNLFEDSSNLQLVSPRDVSRQSVRSSRSSRSCVSMRSPSPQRIDSSSSKRIRGMKLDKYCSREQYYKSKNKPVIDERLFNNFSLEKPDQKHVKDFEKYLNRDLDLSHKNFHDIEYDTKKLFEQCYYKKTTMQCNFKYKGQAITPRQIDKPSRPENQAATDLNHQVVMASYDRCSMSGPRPIEGFYCNTGRQLPCQLDMRANNNLNNYWVDRQSGKVIRKPKEYSLRKQKNDLTQQKIQSLKERKRPKFKKGEICDQMFFRVNSKV